MEITAAILERPVIEKILSHLGLDPQPPARERVREAGEACVHGSLEPARTSSGSAGSSNFLCLRVTHAAAISGQPRLPRAANWRYRLGAEVPANGCVARR
jgi:hypothetical protein